MVDLLMIDTVEYNTARFDFPESKIETMAISMGYLFERKGSKIELETLW